VILTYPLPWFAESGAVVLGSGATGLVWSSTVQCQLTSGSLYLANAAPSAPASITTENDISATINGTLGSGSITMQALSGSAVSYTVYGALRASVIISTTLPQNALSLRTTNTLSIAAGAALDLTGVTMLTPSIISGAGNVSLSSCIISSGVVLSPGLIG
jgi:hypothetical protein